MEELAQQQKAAGILTDEVAPVKLSIGHAPPKPSAVGTERRGVAFDEEEEDEGKKKRVLVKLDPLEGLQGLEREAKRRGLLTKIAKGVPKEGDKDAIFGAAVVWSAINEVRSFARLPSLTCTVPVLTPSPFPLADEHPVQTPSGRTCKA